jgi:hypothetical protein
MMATREVLDLTACSQSQSQSSDIDIVEILNNADVISRGIPPPPLPSNLAVLAEQILELNLSISKDRVVEALRRYPDMDKAVNWLLSGGNSKSIDDYDSNGNTGVDNGALSSRAVLSLPKLHPELNDICTHDGQSEIFCPIMQTSYPIKHCLAVRCKYQHVFSLEGLWGHVRSTLLGDDSYIPACPLANVISHANAISDARGEGEEAGRCDHAMSIGEVENILARVLQRLKGFTTTRGNIHGSVAVSNTGTCTSTSITASGIDSSLIGSSNSSSSSSSSKDTADDDDDIQEEPDIICSAFAKAQDLFLTRAHTVLSHVRCPLCRGSNNEGVWFELPAYLQGEGTSSSSSSSSSSSRASGQRKVDCTSLSADDDVILLTAHTSNGAPVDESSKNNSNSKSNSNNNNNINSNSNNSNSNSNNSNNSNSDENKLGHSHQLRVECPACQAVFCAGCGQSPYHYKCSCTEFTLVSRVWLQWIGGMRDEYVKKDTAASEMAHQFQADVAKHDKEVKEAKNRHKQLEADEQYKEKHCKNCPHCKRIVQRVCYKLLCIYCICIYCICIYCICIYCICITLFFIATMLPATTHYIILYLLQSTTISTTTAPL